MGRPVFVWACLIALAKPATAGEHLALSAGREGWGGTPIY